MFSRNRSAQLLEQPLLSRFAPDLRRRTRAFAYKPHHKIHNTTPRHVEPSQRKTFIALVSSCKTEGEIPSPIVGFQNKILRRPTVSSLFQSCIGGASRSFCERFPNLHRHCPQPGAPIAISLGHSTKKQAELHTNKRRRSFPFASSATRPPMWVGRRPMLRPIFPSHQRRRGGKNGKRRMRPPKFDEKQGERG